MIHWLCGLCTRKQTNMTLLNDTVFTSWIYHFHDEDNLCIQVLIIRSFSLFMKQSFYVEKDPNRVSRKKMRSNNGIIRTIKRRDEWGRRGSNTKRKECLNKRQSLGRDWKREQDKELHINFCSTLLWEKRRGWWPPALIVSIIRRMWVMYVWFERKESNKQSDFNETSITIIRTYSYESHNLLNHYTYFYCNKINCLEAVYSFFTFNLKDSFLNENNVLQEEVMALPIQS